MKKGKVIATAIIKGGGAKTTTAAALAQAAVKDGKKVLCVDLDPQGDFTLALNGTLNTAGAYNLLHKARPMDTIQTTDQGIDLMAAAPDLAEEVTKTGSAGRLRQALAPILKDYDYIIIDTPPQMGELVFNAISAANYVLITTEADGGGLQGMYKTVDIIDHLRDFNPGLKKAYTVITRYDGRPKINRFFLDAITKAGKENGAPLAGVIRQGSAMKEATSLRESIFTYAPRSNPAKDYLSLYEKLK